jgi:hypothetical protein
MDIGRDLIDHRMADGDDIDAGMVDDIWITWRADAARLGPLLSGTPIMLDELGRLGRWLGRVAPRIGWTHAVLWREIDWRSVKRIERPQLRLVEPRSDIPKRRDRRPKPTLGRQGRMRYLELSRLSVRTRDDQRFGIVDVRVGPLVTEPPEVLGLLISPHERARAFGLKRYDSTRTRLGSATGDERFLPWEAIDEITEREIRTRTVSGELGPLAAAPNPAPPPMPEGPDEP